jgi:hypothetical protein
LTSTHCFHRIAGTKQEEVGNVEIERREPEGLETGTTVSAGFGLGRVVLVWVAIGVLLFVIGTALQNSQSIYAGLIIAPVALIGGGLLLKGESALVRFGMVVAAGLILIYVTGTAFSLAVQLGQF